MSLDCRPFPYYHQFLHSLRVLCASVVNQSLRDLGTRGSSLCTSILKQLPRTDAEFPNARKRGQPLQQTFFSPADLGALCVSVVKSSSSATSSHALRRPRHLALRTGHYIEPLTLLVGDCSVGPRFNRRGQSMSDHRHIVVPRADRYGHPEGRKLTALALTSDEHGFAAPHCDKYGHVEGNEHAKKSVAQSKSVFVLR